MEINIQPDRKVVGVWQTQAERNDPGLMIDKIRVFENHLEIQLQSDIFAISGSDTLKDVMPIA